MRPEHSVLERAMRVVSRQAAAARELVHETHDDGLGSHTVTTPRQMLRLELLNVKADLERELGQLVLDCSSCGRRAHWIPGFGVEPGRWAHREPAPHHEPAI